MPILSRKQAKCSVVGHHENKTEYTCRVDEGKSFTVMVDEKGNVEISPKFVVPSPTDYKAIQKALAEQGAKLVI